MSWLRQPAILAVPSRASRSKSAGYWTGERLGFRQTEHQFNGYIDFSLAVYVEKLRELFAVVADCIEKERYLGMVNCLRSIVEHAGVLHEFLLKPAPRLYAESYRSGNADRTAYDPAMEDFDKFMRGNAFPWDELGTTDFNDLGPRSPKAGGGRAGNRAEPGEGAPAPPRGYSFRS